LLNNKTYIFAYALLRVYNTVNIAQSSAESHRQASGDWLTYWQRPRSTALPYRPIQLWQRIFFRCLFILYSISQLPI